MREPRPENAYIQNIRTRKFWVVRYDPGSRWLLQSLPADMDPDPVEQIGWSGNRPYIHTAAADMPGWLLKANRKAQGLTTTQLCQLCGSQGVRAAEHCVGPIHVKFRALVYTALEIDHRPVQVDHDSLRRLRKYLGMSQKTFAKLMGTTDDVLINVAAGIDSPSLELVTRFYSVYAMVPDLTEWPL